MPSLLGALGAALARRWKLSLLAGLTLLVALVVGGGSAGGAFVDDLRLPGTDSQRAADVLERVQGPQADAPGTATVVLSDSSGLGGEVLSATAARLSALPGVARVAEARVSPDGTIAVLDVAYDRPSEDVASRAYDDLAAVRAEVQRGGTTVALAGDVVLAAEPSVPPLAEVIGVLVAGLVLALVLRSAVAVLITLALAILSLIGGLGVLGYASSVTDLPELSLTLGTMLGLGAGIDYALLLLTRFRERRRAGDDVPTAVRAMHRSAGEAVATAGVVVVAALCGLLLSGIGFVGRLGVGIALVVATVVVLSLLLAPAVLGAVGHRVRFRVTDDRPTAAGRWGALLARRPGPIAVLGLFVLLVLAAPVASLSVGSPDDSARPTGDGNRQAYDLIAAGFGSGANGTLVVVLALPTARSAPAVDKVAEALATTPGISSVQEPAFSPDRRSVAIGIQPGTGPQDGATADLVERLRTQVLPAATAGTGASAYVGGRTALDDDLAAKVSERLPIIIGAVLLASVVLIAALVKAPVIALVSAVLTLLSVGAAYGMAVAAFQWEWASGPLGLGDSTPIPAGSALLLFVILFGLSMDYNIFLLSRMREHHQATGRAREAVVESLRSTAGVVLSAGVIMVAVFCAFATSPEPTVRITAAALAAAVTVDLLLVRLLLSPAVLLLLGDRAWRGGRRPRIGAPDAPAVAVTAVRPQHSRA